MSEKIILDFHPLTRERWPDLEKLFGKRGACGGCWCMYWRLKRSQFLAQKGEGNRIALKRIVDSGQIPGIIAYSEKEPVGWCSVAPREAFQTLERSRILKRVDDEPVWSVVCFFVARTFRGKGVSVALLKTVLDYVRDKGGKVVEGYPNELGTKLPDAFVYTGLASAFRKAAFLEVVRRLKSRSIMRYTLRKQ